MSETVSKPIETIQAGPMLSEAGAPPRLRTVIRARRGWQLVDLREIWKYRELLYFLTWRDIKVRYKQTVLGTAWSVIQPLTQTVIFAVIFGRVMRLDQQTGETPYIVFLFAGLIAWNLFSGGLSGASTSVLTSGNVITKIYFPRLLIPVAAVGVNVVNFLITLGVFVAMMAWFRIVPGPQILLLPIFMLLILMASLAVGIGLSALMVVYRDVRNIAPFIVQMLLYLTPVIYPVKIIPEAFRWIIAINPMTGLIGAFRWCLVGGDFAFSTLIVSVLITVVGFLISVFCFRRMEAVFADII